MKFFYVDSVPFNVTDGVYLHKDGWDDYFQFATTYHLTIVYQGNRFRPGNVKIASENLSGADVTSFTIGQSRTPLIPNEFTALDDTYYSLGQSEDYYKSISRLGEDIMGTILRALRDCAYDLSIFNKFEKESAMTTSLLREINAITVRNRLHRLASGDAELSRYSFKFRMSSDNVDNPSLLQFDVLPESTPPTNIHVLIGRNGVGKTTLLQLMTQSILQDPLKSTSNRLIRENGDEWTFTGLVYASFSIFDEFDITELKGEHSSPIANSAKQIGLNVKITEEEMQQINSEASHLRKNTQDDSDSHLSGLDILAFKFFIALKRCKTGLNPERWKAAIATLENDPLFKEIQISRLIDLHIDKCREKAIPLYKRLSSGHACVLLTITQLVAFVEEGTIVLFDEPESHLHPPLLSAFITSLSDLLIKRNAVAIIATHSPVVLQEVPCNCVWVLHRAGKLSSASRPIIETFGENVGTLTREVFGLEVTGTGYHSMITKTINEIFEPGAPVNDLYIKRMRGAKPFELLKEKYKEQLGMEAQIIARSLIVKRDKDETDVEA